MDALELVGVGAWSFAVALAGGTVGLVLGNLRLPFFVLAASSPAAGGGANIAVSGIAAAHRLHDPCPRRGDQLAPVRLDGAALGCGRSDGPLLRGQGAGERTSARDRGGAALRRARPPAAPAGSGPPRSRRRRSGDRPPRRLRRLDPRLAAHAHAATPRGRATDRAVGTNLAVGVCVGVAGLLGHLPSAAPDYRLVLAGGGASIPGALLGARLTGRLSERRLVQAIGAAAVAQVFF